MKWIKLKSPVIREREIKFQEFCYPVLSKQYLSQPFMDKNPSFFEVTERRRSSRLFKQLSDDKLNALLWYTSRTISLSPPKSGVRWQHRPSPSGGGRHPIDVFIIDNSEIPKSVLLYQSVSHSLAKLRINNECLNLFLNFLEKVLPAQECTIVWFGAQFQRSLSKYENGESLVWRDAGALSATFAFVAEALEINCCPIGPIGEPYFSQIFNAGGKVSGVGGLYVGNRE